MWHSAMCGKYPLITEKQMSYYMVPLGILEFLERYLRGSLVGHLEVVNMGRGEKMKGQASDAVVSSTPAPFLDLI